MSSWVVHQPASCGEWSQTTFQSLHSLKLRVSSPLKILGHNPNGKSSSSNNPWFSRGWSPRWLRFREGKSFVSNQPRVGLNHPAPSPWPTMQDQRWNPRPQTTTTRPRSNDCNQFPNLTKHLREITWKQTARVVLSLLLVSTNKQQRLFTTYIYHSIPLQPKGAPFLPPPQSIQQDAGRRSQKRPNSLSSFRTSPRERGKKGDEMKKTLYICRKRNLGIKIKMSVWRLVVLFSVKTISHLVSHLQTKQHETQKSKYNGHDDHVCQKFPLQKHSNRSTKTYSTNESPNWKLVGGFNSFEKC